MNRRHMFISFGAMTAIVIAAFVLLNENGFVQQVNAQNVTPTHKPAPPPLATPTGSGQAPLALTLPGTLTADESVELYAKASGYISQIEVDIGSRVRQGDVLVQLDIPEMHDELRHNQASVAARRSKIEVMKAKATQARLTIESALARQKRVEAELALSRITHQRKAKLFEEKAIPQQEFDVAENQLAVSQAELAITKANVESARAEGLTAQAEVKFADADLSMVEADTARLKTLLRYATVTAPFDGIITRRDVDHGDFVRSAAQGADSPLLVIEKIDRLRLVIDVPETHAPLVRPGAQVHILLRANGEESIAAITRTASSLRSDTRTMRTEVDLDNADGRFMPGMYAKVSIQLSAKEQNPLGA